MVAFWAPAGITATAKKRAATMALKPRVAGRTLESRGQFFRFIGLRLQTERTAAKVQIPHIISAIVPVNPALAPAPGPGVEEKAHGPRRFPRAMRAFETIIETVYKAAIRAGRAAG